MMNRWVFAVLLLNAVVDGIPKPLNRKLDLGQFDHEVIEIDVTGGPTYYGNDMPTSFDLKTTTFGEELNLHVKKLPSIFHENYRMYSLELDSNNEPVFRLVNLQRHDQPIYQDNNKTCVLHLSYDDGHVQMEGTLTPELSIIPAGVVGLRTKRNSHVVVRAKPSSEERTRGDYYDITPFTRAATMSKVQGTVLPKVINPELLAIVDYKNAESMNFDDDQIQKYLAIFWNAVNTRYALVPDPKIELLLVGSVVTKDPQLQRYIEDSRMIVDDKDAINLHQTLPALHEFIYQNKKMMPAFDIAMLMTGEDMSANVGDGIMDTTIAGAAPVGGACDVDSGLDGMVKSAGMAEDRAPLYSGVLNHAHEIAHLLGSVHDGDPPYKRIPGHPGAQDCPWTDGYLMSYKFGDKKHLRWSNCTVNQFRFFFGLDHASCLWSVENPLPFPLNSSLPGQLVDLDGQCKAFMGPTAKYFRDQNMIYVCYALYCYKNDDLREIYARGPAYEGSPCGYDGDARWCRDGTCRLKSFGY